MRIAVDAMGGDNAPQEIVKGCVAAAEKLDGEIILIGREDEIMRELMLCCDEIPSGITICDAPEVIENDERPVQAVRRKRNSSMLRAIDAVKNGEADAALSAGNTGALMTASLLHLGRIPGIDRPAIVSVLPAVGQGGRLMILVDAGANSECKPKNLLEFAYMGSIYMRYAYGIEDPAVGLINIGVEETKGTTVLKKAYQLLKDSHLNFVGNVEARDIPYGLADVLVCDGFTGNIVLKLTEGVAWALLKTVRSKISEGMLSKAGGLLLMRKFKEMKMSFNYEKYGAAPILGVNGLVFKMHGTSTAFGVENSLIGAERVASGNAVEEIAAAIKSYK